MPSAFTISQRGSSCNVTCVEVVGEMSKLVDKLTTEEVIAEVKKWRLLWDPTLEAYQNKFLRSKAWRKIMARLIPSSLTMSSAEQSEIETAFRKKWKSIRTCYSRELLRQKKSDDPVISGRRQYQYYDQLRFLDFSSKDEPVETEEDTNTPDLLPNPCSTSTVQASVNKTTENKKRKLETSSVNKINKRQMVRYRNYELENEADKMFLLSLVPDLQMVSPGVKLQLKLDIMNAILKAQQQDPLSEAQLYVPEDNDIYPNSSNSTMWSVHNSALLQHSLRALQQDDQNDEIYLPQSHLEMECVKLETADSVSSLDERGSLVGSEDCDVTLT